MGICQEIFLGGESERFTTEDEEEPQRTQRKKEGREKPPSFSISAIPTANPRRTFA
jgi:hypothetical protein